MNKQIEQDIAWLKKDFGKFKQDIGSIVSDAGNFSQDKVHETKEKLTSALHDFEGMAVDTAGRVNEYAHEKADHAIEYSRDMVVRHPLTTVLVSFAVGAVTAFLLGKHHE